MASERPARPVPHVTDASLAQIPSLIIVSADYTSKNFPRETGRVLVIEPAFCA